MNLLPIFLDLRERRVLLAGAGAVATQKAAQLLDAGARLRIVAPQSTPLIQGWAQEQKAEWLQRTFHASDLDGCVLAIAATNDSSVNAAVYREATQRGILANSVDDPKHCAYFFSSNVRRGPLQIAISTSGESPAFGQRLRNSLDAQLPADLGEKLHALGTERRRILQSQPSTPTRTVKLKQLAERLFHDAQFNFAARDYLQYHPAPEKNDIGMVYLVGAGPGDPELLTVKALRLIQSADVILHDDLVSQEILALARPAAQLIPVGKRCGTKSVTQEEIHERMIDFAYRHKTVVRLKGGDPLLFGRAAEEMEALRAARIHYQIVPGITAAFAAAAAAERSLTSRTSASSLLLTSGHLAAGHRTGNSLPTRVVYMPGTDDWRALANRLLEEGLRSDLPCMIVSQASRRGEKIAATTLGQLGSLTGIPAPSVLLIGEAMAVPSQRNQRAETDARAPKRCSTAQFDK
jgi:uroporphyrin-III C-methyltransferase/precorrin-2 dehydrogenase/sirohydrochlorin ferrochelatase